MSIVVTQDNPLIYQINLTQVEDEAEIDLKEILQSSREFIIGQNSVFGGAKIKIARYISENTGYTDYVSPETGEVVEITNSGAGYALGWLHKAGKFKFYLEDATETTDIKIDLFK